MGRRAYVQSGERQRLADRLLRHVHQALHHSGGCAVVVLRPLTQQIPQEGQVVGFDPVVERIRELIRRSDMLEVDPADGIGIVLSETGSEGARAVFMRLRDALGSPIPPDAPREASLAISLGYAASSSFSGGMATMETTRNAAYGDADTAVSSLEATSAAMIRAAWQPHMALSLTLPVLAHATRPATHTRTHTRREPGMEMGPQRPRCRAEEDDVLASEAALPVGTMLDTGDTGNTGGLVAQQRTTQRGHLRLVVSQQMVLPEIEAMRALARTLGVPFVRMPTHLSRACRTAVHPSVACELRAVPIGHSRGTLTIAMHDPSDTNALQRLRAMTGLCIFPVLAAPDEIDRALRQLMGE